MTQTAAHDALAALISKVSLGDRKAFRLLYSQTSPKLFGVCLRILKQQAQAEDALQEIFVKIWQRSSSFAAGNAPPMGWLVTIARNHCIDLLRVRRGDHVEFDDAPPIADDAPNPEASAIGASEGRRIDNCLGELDADRARAVVGAYVEGYSYEELAAEHKVPLNTMRTWLRRALINLRECLER